MVVWLRSASLCASVAQVSGPPLPTPQSADTQGYGDLVCTYLHPSWRSDDRIHTIFIYQCHSVEDVTPSSMSSLDILKVVSFSVEFSP